MVASSVGVVTGTLVRRAPGEDVKAELAAAFGPLVVLLGQDRANQAVWVPETPHSSRDLLILVEQSTEPVVSSNACGRARGRLGEWS